MNHFLTEPMLTANLPSLGNGFGSTDIHEGNYLQGKGIQLHKHTVKATVRCFLRTFLFDIRSCVLEGYSKTALR